MIGSFGQFDAHSENDFHILECKRTWWGPKKIACETFLQKNKHNVVSPKNQMVLTKGQKYLILIW